jgi:drug/metabolite transporter (DMT)-like permease
MQRYWPTLFLLAAIWGASYLFIEVGIEDIPPAALTFFRLLIAGILLGAYLVHRLGRGRALSELRAAWRPCLVLGIINAALPMTLVAWGQTHIDSSIAAIAQSSVPIFVVLLSLRFLPHDSLGRPARLAGLALGIAGVALVTGIHPDGGWWAAAGTLAVVLSSLSYASGAVFGQLRVHGTPGPVLATGSMVVGTLALLPFAVAEPPTEAPGITSVAALLALALLPTFFGQLLLFRMLRLYGSGRLSLVTFLMPGFALVYGGLLLDEPVPAAALGGLALILGGVALASGQRFPGARAQESAA